MSDQIDNFEAIRTVEEYLHKNIPLSKAMAVSILSINDSGIVLSAPLQPNINHRSTVFGGSMSALSILAAWTLVYVRLKAQSVDCRIVIQRNWIEYIKPIEGEFQAHCHPPSQAEWERFVQAILRRGKGRIILNCDTLVQGLLAGKFQGEYVAFRL